MTVEFCELILLNDQETRVNPQQVAYLLSRDDRHTAIYFNGREEPISVKGSLQDIEKALSTGSKSAGKPRSSFFGTP